MHISHEKWREYRAQCELEGASKEVKADFDNKTLELRNQIRSLEWDIEDIEETHSMYGSYPSKTKLSQEELAKRTQFIQDTKAQLQQIKEEVFDAKYNLKEDSISYSLFSNPIGFYSIAFDGKQNNRYKRLDEEPSTDNNNLSNGTSKTGNDLRIDMKDPIPSNDLRFAREIEQMAEEEGGDTHLNSELIDNYDYSNGEFNQVYQPTLNVISDGKYDSPFKRMVRSIPISASFLIRNRVYSVFAAFSAFFVFGLLIHFL